MNELFDHLGNVYDGDIVEITEHNELNQSDKPIGFIFRRKDHLSSEVIIGLFPVSQSHSRFNALDTLTIVVHSVKIPDGFGGNGIKRKGRTLARLFQIKRSIIELGAEEKCLAHALIIEVVRIMIRILRLIGRV